MSKSKNDLNIHFTGKPGDLVIKLNGDIIFPYQEEKPKKEINPNKLKTQLKAGVAAVFSGAVNRIKPLQDTWKRWPVKSRVPYRNILSANIKRCTEEHPTTANMICAGSGHSLTNLEAHINTNGIKIDVPSLADKIDFHEKEKIITAAGILSVYSPRVKGAESFSIYPLSMEIYDFKPSENISGTFPFSAEMLENISNYEKCILYFTVIIGRSAGRSKRWFDASSIEYLLHNDANGKFEKGEQLVFVTREKK